MRSVRARGITAALVGVLLFSLAITGTYAWAGITDSSGEILYGWPAFWLALQIVGMALAATVLIVGLMAAAVTWVARGE